MSNPHIYNLGMESGNTEDDNKGGEFRQRRLTVLETDPLFKDFNESLKRKINDIPSKFSNANEIVEKIETTFSEKKVDAAEIEFAREFGEALHAAYFVSSGALTKVLGPALLLRAFRALAPIMQVVLSEDDSDAYQDLPDELVLYRGGKGPRVELAKGLSWTLSKNIAKNYMDAEGSIMIRSQTRKRDLLAYFSVQKECIIDPSKLVSVELVHDVD